MPSVASSLVTLALFVVAGCGAGEIDRDSSGQDELDGGERSADAGPGAPVAGEPSELAGITAAHNQIRSAHGVGDIVWDNELAAVAKGWADGCQWGHNEGRSDDYPGYVGENIYGASFVPSGADVVGSWASEESDYDYDSNSCGGVCGHYTQIVWADSVKLGCAISHCPGGTVENMVVCDYAPGGNIGGQRPY